MDELKICISLRKVWFSFMVVYLIMSRGIPTRYLSWVAYAVLQAVGTEGSKGYGRGAVCTTSFPPG